MGINLKKKLLFIKIFGLIFAVLIAHNLFILVFIIFYISKSQLYHTF